MSTAEPRSIVVVPCFNEARRLDRDEFRRLARRVNVWLVDDGSTDDTGRTLDEIAAESPTEIRARSNPRNLGKAETVRSHLLAACETGAPIVGFLDADLATPIDELLSMLDVIESGDAAAVTAARVGLSGRDVRRKALRHYSGRVFSTIASVALRTAYYDTQCGAKLFRASPELRSALSEPFLSRWAFDVELLGRLLAGAPGIAPVPASRLVEYPVQVWHDVPGSKLTTLDAWRSLVELLLIWRDLRRRRRRRA